MTNENLWGRRRTRAKRVASFLAPEYVLKCFFCILCLNYYLLSKKTPALLDDVLRGKSVKCVASGEQAVSGALWSVGERRCSWRQGAFARSAERWKVLP